MKVYKVWFGLDKGTFKLETEWEKAVKQLSLCKRLIEHLEYKTCGIDEVEAGICKVCKRVTLKEDLEMFSGICFRCENECYDAQRDLYLEEENGNK